MMRQNSVFFIIILGLLIITFGMVGVVSASTPLKQINHLKMPIIFTPNQGQFDSQVKYLSRGPGYNLFLTENEAVLTLYATEKPVTDDKNLITKSDVVRMSLIGNQKPTNIKGLDEVNTKYNYYIGNDKSKWKNNISNFAKVRVEAVYPGIDLVYYGKKGLMEYDFIVSPGSDPSQIGLKYEGMEKAEIDENGDLVLHTKLGPVTFHKPLAYQDKEGKHQQIDCQFYLSENQVGFKLAAYDVSKSLVIDPTLVFSTCLGGSGSDYPGSLAVDPQGNIYIGGTSNSSDYPTTNAYQTYNKGNFDLILTKISADYTTIMWSTFFGGAGGHESVQGVVVDSEGYLIVVGNTASNDFPMINAMDDSFNGGTYDAYVLKMTGDGVPRWSTYVGGTNIDGFHSISVDSNNDIVAAGLTTSSDFPVVNGYDMTYNGGNDVGVTKIKSDGSAIIWSTYLGGSGTDGYTHSVDIDSNNNVVVAGLTTSTNFPVKNAYQDTNAGGEDGFVTKILSDGSDLVFSTYVGGPGKDQFRQFALDYEGNICIGGVSTGQFPIRNAFCSYYHAGDWNPLIVKMKGDGSDILWATYFSGFNDYDVVQNLTVDPVGNVIFGGYAQSTNMLMVDPVQATFAGGNYDAYIAKLSSDGSELLFSTYLGGSTGPGSYGGDEDIARGIVTDQYGDIYLAGGTKSSDFPTVNPLYSYGGGDSDIFVAKIEFEKPQKCPVACITPDYPINVGTFATFSSCSYDPDENYPLTYQWSLIPPDGCEITEPLILDSPTFTFPVDCQGEYVVNLAVTDSFDPPCTSEPLAEERFSGNTCPYADAGSDQVKTVIGDPVYLGIEEGRQSYDNEGDPISYLWTMTPPPGSLAALVNPTSPTPIFTPDVYGDYIVRLQVKDDYFEDWCSEDMMVVSFDDVKPVAVPCCNDSICLSDSKTLDGSESYDPNAPEGDLPLNFSWSIVSKPAGSLVEELTNSNTAYPTFTPDVVGTYEVQLIVNDNLLDSDPVKVDIQVTYCSNSCVWLLQELITVINDLEKSELKNRNMKKALVHKVTATIEKVVQEDYQDAINKLQNDILKKTDGASENVPPDNNDWIMTWEAQSDVRFFVLEAIDCITYIMQLQN